MRNFNVMRGVLSTVAKADGELGIDSFMWMLQRNDVIDEIARLKSDGIISGTMKFKKDLHEYVDGTISGLTDEGVEFYRLIENDGVWEIVLATLRKANIDISYPLLKEVCEEIVKRYVTSCIPEI